MSALCQKRTLERRLFDHLVGAGENCWWNIQTKRLRCFEINDQIEFYGLLDRELCRVCALENLIDIRGDTKSGLGQIVDTVSIRERPSY